VFVLSLNLGGLTSSFFTQWATRAAAQGDPDSLNCLGWLHQNGGEYCPRDERAAARCYARAAEGGSALGYFNLAFMYRNGEYVAVDRAEVRLVAAATSLCLTCDFSVDKADYLFQQADVRGMSFAAAFESYQNEVNQECPVARKPTLGDSDCLARIWL
jgi:TPR repeat protein